MQKVTTFPFENSFYNPSFNAKYCPKQTAELMTKGMNE